MGKKIINAYKNVALSKAGLLSKAKEDLAKERLAICVSNVCQTYEDGTCLKSKGGCGCVMKRKVYCTKCKCPKNYW